MTEAEWLECTRPNSMLIYLRPWRKRSRKLRLYVCAWSRYCWRMLNEPCRALIDISERYIDGLVSRAEFTAGKRAVTNRAQQERSESRQDGLAEIGLGLLAELQLEHLPGWEGMRPPTYSFVGTEKQRNEYDTLRETLTQYQLNLLHDIFGNPFRQVSADPAWLIPDMTALAQSAYDERPAPDGVLQTERLAVLADALEEIGADSVTLGHLRSAGLHVRGCWVLDLLLGKS